MSKSIDYKTKNKLLLGGIGLGIFLAWWLAIRPTVALYQENKQLQTQVAEAHTAPQEIHTLEKQLNVLTNKMSAFDGDSLDQAERVFDMVSGFCQKNKLILKDLSPTHIADEGEFKIMTSEVLVEGGFIRLLQLVRAIEEHKEIGRISSVNYYSYIDTKLKRTILVMKLSLQNIKIQQ